MVVSGPFFSFPVKIFFNNTGRHKIFLITQGAFTGYQFKVFIETGEIIKSALITELLDT